MSDSGIYGGAGAYGTKPPIVTFAMLTATLSVALLAGGHLFFVSLPAAAFAFAVCVMIVARGLRHQYPHAAFGSCNTVTMTRAALVALVFGALFQASAVSGWVVFAIAAVALALDGVDGWLARRSGLASAFGARFDMETDAALGAILASWILVSDIAGPEILLLGFMRYGFVLAGWIWPELTRDLPPSMRRKAICVVQIAALVALCCPLMPQAVAPWVSLGASALLTYSFAVDVRWLFRHAQ